MTKIHASHAPNVLAFDYPLESGTVVTIYRAVPGQGVPRMQMRLRDGAPVDCGPIENPERFGPYETPEEFRDWVTNFAQSA